MSMMTSLQPAVWVNAPAFVPYRFGLLSTVAAQPFSDPHERAGVTWRSSGCGSAGTTLGACTVDSTPDPLDPNVACSISGGVGFTVFARSDESIGGGTADEKFTAAQDWLLAGEQHAVEGFLWNLLVAELTAPGAETVEGADINEAVALLEQAMADNYGGSPVIHMNRANTLLAHDVLYRDALSLSTMIGSTVVAGGGYGDEFAAVATGALMIHRGPIEQVGRQYAESINSIDAVVARDYIVGWDCAAVSATIA